MRSLSSSRSKRNEGGFSLIEVMVALLLLLIGISGILTIQLSSMKASAYSRHATEAIILAEDKMEELMTISAATIADGNDTVDSQGVDDVAGFYERSWVVEPTGPLNTITVQVSWDEKGTEPHSISFATQRRL